MIHKKMIRFKCYSQLQLVLVRMLLMTSQDTTDHTHTHTHTHAHTMDINAPVQVIVCRLFRTRGYNERATRLENSERLSTARVKIGARGPRVIRFDVLYHLHEGAFGRGM